jgi:branched-chain amino acid transport system permease protein
MTDFLQLLLSGVATGAIYAMAALGFTLLWQAAGTINFAQGEFVMLPAFAMLIGMSFGLPLWASFILAVASWCLGQLSKTGLSTRCAAAVLWLSWWQRSVFQSA